VLLTRSPLSPGPKPRFSLDLHVLSAPPAFVLSQDQTLREETMRPLRRESSLQFELALLDSFSPAREASALQEDAAERPIHKGVNGIYASRRTVSENGVSRREVSTLRC
jgi:hypothetical protein